MAGILGLVLNMAAYQTSAYAVNKTASWASGVMRRGVVKYSKFLAETTYNSRAVQLMKTTFTKAARLIGEPNLAPQDVTEKLINRKVDTFRQSFIAAGQRRLSKITNPRMRKWIGTMGRVAKDEIQYLPSNYIMYRIEKNQAVSPQERDRYSNFMKYYVGTPMVMSMGIGALMHARQGGGINRASSWLAKKASRPIRRGVTMGVGVLEAAVPIAERGIAAMRARRTMTESRGLLSLIGTHDPKDVMMSFKRHYGEQLRNIRAVKDKPYAVIGKQADAIGDFIFKQMHGVSMKEVPPEARMNMQLFKTQPAIEEMKKRIYEGYSGEMTKRSRTLNFVNKILEASGNSDMQFRRSMQKVSVGGENMEIPVGPGILEMGKRQYNLGPLSMTFMKDALIKRSDRGLPRFALSLFGQREMAQYLHSEHALSTSWRVGRGASRLVMPHALVEDVVTHDNPTDIGLMIMGKKPGHATREEEDLARAFVDTRLQAYKKKFEVDDPEARTMFMTSARRGELFLQSSDVLVQAPGGAMSMIVQMEREGQRVAMPISIGGTPGGQMLKFHQFTSRSNNIASKLYRRWLGSEDYVIKRGNQAGTSVTLGPATIGKVTPQPEATGILAKLKHFATQNLELGQSEDTGLLSRIGSIFMKHTDPRNPTTLFSKEYLGRTGFVKDMLKDDRSINDFVNLLHEQSTEATDMAYMNIVMRAGRMRGDGTPTQKLMAHLAMHENKLPVGYTTYMIEDSMTVDQGKTAISNLLERLRKESRPAGDRTRMIFTKEIKELEGMLRKFPDSEILSPEAALAPESATRGRKTVYDLLGNTYDHSKVPVFGKSRQMTSVDKYNASVLRIVNNYNTVLTHIDEMAADHAVTMAGLSGKNYSEKIASGIDSIFNALPSNIYTASDRRVMTAATKLTDLYSRTSYHFASIDGTLDVGSRQEEVGKIARIIDNFTGKTNKAVSDMEHVQGYYNRRVKYQAFAPVDLDGRSKIEAPEYDEIFLIPKTGYSGPISKRKFSIDGQTLEIAQGVMDSSNIAVMSMFHAFNRTASEILGVGLNEATTALPKDYLRKITTKRVLPTLGAFMAYSVLNRAADEFLDGTPFGEGLTTFGANVLAGARVGAQGILDMTGATGMFKYLEDLMPGFVTSPGSGLVRGVGPMVGGMLLGARQGPRNALTGGIIGAAVGGLLGGGPLGLFGMWDVSKSRKEVVQELTGEKEIAVRKGRWWELNASPFEGTRIEYFRPHIYAMQRADYKRAPGFKDSLMTEFLGAIAPDIYAAKNYYSRPYPATAGLFAGIPVISDMARMIPGVGRMLGGGIQMHDEALEGSVSTGYMMRQASKMGFGTETIASMFGERSGMYGDMQGGTGQPGIGYGGMGGQAGVGPEAIATTDPESALSSTMLTMKDIVGLRGWLGGVGLNALTGRGDMFDYAPRMASPVDVAGARRSYWDLNLGGLIGASEVLRRYIPHTQNQIQVYNPIRNTMPDWLPGRDYYIDLQHGDPFTAVPMGEARLPGASYETLHRVSLDMPLEGEVLGEDVDSQIAYMLGLPNYMTVRNSKTDMIEGIKAETLLKAQRYGDLVKDETHVYSASMDLHSYVDAIVRAANGKKTPVKIAPKGLAGAADLNAFMVMSNTDQGLLMEVDPESGAVTEQLLHKDVKAFERQLATAREAQSQARVQAERIAGTSTPYNLMNAYSWFDRYKILADVAPYSKEFRRADSIVQQQMMAGRLGRESSEYYAIKDQIEDKQRANQFAEYRFNDLGKSLTAYGKARDETVRQEYSYLERQVGAAWEKLGHTRSFLGLKFMNSQSPLEAYERQALYGKEMKMWQIIPMDYLGSHANLMMGETHPVQGAITGAITGFVLGGGPVGAAMGMLGAATATYNTITDNTYIPNRVIDRREVVNQMDAVKYAKLQMMYQETGDVKYQEQAARTMTGAAIAGEVMDPKMVGFPLSTPERNYIEDIINNVTTDNVERVAAILPKPAVASMYQAIGQTGQAQTIMREFGREQEERALPDPSSSVYSPDVPIASPMITTMEMRGMNAHDAGFGWYDQQAALIRSQHLGVYNGESLYPEPFETKVTVKDFKVSVNADSQIRSLLQPYSSNVMISNDGSDRIELEVVTRNG